MLYANTNQQVLSEHSEAVARLAVFYRRAWFCDEQLEKWHINPVSLDVTVKQAGLDHDLGKVSPTFQDYLNRKVQKGDDYTPVGEDAVFDIQNNSLHHEISWWIACMKLESGLLPPGIIAESYLYAIYWHHAKPERDGSKADSDLVIDHIRLHETKIREGLNSLGEVPEHLLPRETVYGQTIQLGTPFKVVGEYSESDGDITTLAVKFEDVQRRNVINSIVRLCLISADRYISGLIPAELSRFLTFDNTDMHCFDQDISAPLLCPAIDTYIQTTSDIDPDRHEAQLNAARGLADYDHITCNGETGVGKTRIAMQAHYQRQKRYGKAHPLLWICPRVAVCEGVFDELSRCLPDTSIQLLTGQEKRFRFQGEELADDVPGRHYDITVTTIDQIAKTLLSHAEVTNLHQYLSASVVFDEFHELFETPVFIPLFHELAMLKYLQSEQDLTLISGTINPLLLTLFPKAFQDPVTCASFNQTVYETRVSAMAFEETKKPAVTHLANSLLITNLAYSAQVATLDRLRDDTLCFHGSFTRDDRASQFSQLMNLCGKEGYSYPHAVKAGPAAQAALNISRQHGQIEISTPENTLQRIGRVSRFGEYSRAGLQLFTDQSRLKTKNGLSRIKNRIFEQNGIDYLAGAFHEYLALVFSDQKEQVLRDFSRHYYRFYQLLLGKHLYLDDVEITAFSQAILARNLDPLPGDWEKICKSVSLNIQTMVAENHYVSIDGMLAIWKDNLKGELSGKRLKDAIKHIDILRSLAPRWRRAGALTLQQLLFKGAEITRANTGFEPLKRQSLTKNKPVTNIRLRGNSINVTAPVIVFHYDSEGRVNGLSFDGYLHEQSKPMSIDPARITGNVELERLNEDVLRDIDRKRYDHHVKSCKYGNKNFAIRQRVLIDAQMNERHPYWLGWVYDTKACDSQLAESLRFPGFIYVKACFESGQMTPVGLMEFSSFDVFVVLLKSLDFDY